MGFLTGRLIMWVVAGGISVALIIGLYTGAIQKGASAEFAKWQTVVSERKQAVREVNHQLNEQTAEYDRNLQMEEHRIYEKWAHPEISQ